MFPLRRKAGFRYKNLRRGGLRGGTTWPATRPPRRGRQESPLGSVGGICRWDL